MTLKRDMVYTEYAGSTQKTLPAGTKINLNAARIESVYGAFIKVTLRI